MRAVMSSRGFTSAFAAELEAYLAFKASMGFYGTSRIWYLKRFDAYCSEHNRTVFDRDTVEEWVGVQLQHSGRYRSWMSYIRDFGRWLSTHGATDAYVLSESWKAPILAPHPYLLAAREIELFFSAAFVRAADRRNPRTAARASRFGWRAHRHRLVQRPPQPQTAVDRSGRRDPNRLRPNVAKALRLASHVFRLC